MATDWSKWERTRAKGRTRFVLVFGVLFWGVLVAIFFSLAMGALVPGSQFGLILGLALIFFPIGGIFWGLSVWRLTERKYLQSKQVGEP